MKRQRPEAAGDRLALADQSGCCEVAQLNGKARALPACDGKPFNHDGSATAEEAALHVTRTPGAQSSAAPPQPMTAEEALAQTEAEGLTLARSDNESGYRNVFTRPHSKVRPYEAKVWRDSKHVHIGCFDTAEEAALHVARTPEGANRVALPPPMTAAVKRLAPMPRAAAVVEHRIGVQRKSIWPEPPAPPRGRSIGFAPDPFALSPRASGALNLGPVVDLHPVFDD